MSIRFRLALVLPLASLFATSVAAAAGIPERDRVAPAQEPEMKSLSLELNPIGMAIGRYSVNVEYLPLPHHALVLNPYFAYVNADVQAGDVEYSQSFVGGGGELGYRFYTGSKGPHGFYVGPSFLFGQYSASQDAVGSIPATSAGFTTLGGAIDIGGQAMVGPGIVIGGGFGVQYTKATEDFEDLPFAAAILAGGGFRPRVLLSAGFAF
jgi:hypothetical protein